MHTKHTWHDYISVATSMNFYAVHKSEVASLLDRQIKCSSMCSCVKNLKVDNRMQDGKNKCHPVEKSIRLVMMTEYWRPHTCQNWSFSFTCDNNIVGECFLFNLGQTSLFLNTIMVIGAHFLMSHIEDIYVYYISLYVVKSHMYV